MTDQLWVEPVGDLVIARLRGEPTEAILRECHHRVLHIAAVKWLGEDARPSRLRKVE